MDRETKRFVVGFGGARGAGKDEACRFLCRHSSRDIRCLSFAAPLRNSLSLLLGGEIAAADTITLSQKSRLVWASSVGTCEREFVERIELALANVVSGVRLSRETLRRAAATLAAMWRVDFSAPFPTLAPHSCGAPVTVGRLLQVFGTDVGRRMVDEDVWLRPTVAKAKALLAAGVDVAFSDARFDNETAAVRELGGRVVLIDAAERLARGVATLSGDGRSSDHASEAMAQDPAKFDLVIANTDSLGEFHDALTQVFSHTAIDDFDLLFRFYLPRVRREAERVRLAALAGSGSEAHDGAHDEAHGETHMERHTERKNSAGDSGSAGEREFKGELYVSAESLPMPMGLSDSELTPRLVRHATLPPALPLDSAPQADRVQDTSTLRRAPTLVLPPESSTSPASTTPCLSAMDIARKPTQTRTRRNPSDCAVQ